MPVPITRTDWRLDRVIEFLKLQPVPEGEPPRTTVRADGRPELVLAWQAEPSEEASGFALMFVTVFSERIRSFDTGFGWYALEGALTAPFSVTVDGRLAEVVSFRAVPPDPQAVTPFTSAAVTQDGHVASWPADTPIEAPGPDIERRFGVAVELSPRIPFAGTAAVRLLVEGGFGTDAGTRRIAFGQGVKRWAQREDSRETLAGVAETPGEFAVVAGSETVEYVVRKLPPEGSVALLDERGLYAVESVAELARGRFWRVTATRSVTRDVF